MFGHNNRNNIKWFVLTPIIMLYYLFPCFAYIYCVIFINMETSVLFNQYYITPQIVRSMHLTPRKMHFTEAKYQILGKCLVFEQIMSSHLLPVRNRMGIRFARNNECKFEAFCTMKLSLIWSYRTAQFYYCLILDLFSTPNWWTALFFDELRSFGIKRGRRSPFWVLRPGRYACCQDHISLLSITHLIVVHVTENAFPSHQFIKRSFLNDLSVVHYNDPVKRPSDT